MEELIQYLKTWLLYGNEEAARMVGYTADEKEWSKYKVVIVPNGHLGKDWVMPEMSNPRLEDGKIIRLDLLYNTAFFTSRAEELLNPERDKHGRFLAAYSILGKNNRLMIPMLDEYARFLIKAVHQACEAAEEPSPVALPKPGFSKIWLTHDIDCFDRYRHLRGAIGGLMRGQWREVFAAWRDIHNDPAYTYPQIIELDRRLSKTMDNVQVIYFVKHTQGKGYDYPQYSRHSHEYVRLRTAIKSGGDIIGIHSSYYGFEGKTDHHCHRSHFLRCDIDNMQRLVGSGVTDDFTMQFPDRCGFRLQTSRAVRWINPKTWELTPLTLHPLTVMDCTLSNAHYMNLTEDEAFFFCERLFDKIRQNNGELVLLWHNIDPSGKTTLKSLYPKLLSLITE